MNLKNQLGKRIQDLRKAQNFTQERLAEKVNIDITSLSKIETGRNYPQPETLEKIANALGIEISQLFVFSENLSKSGYIDAINRNIDFIKNDDEKLKLLYKISCALV